MCLCIYFLTWCACASVYMTQGFSLFLSLRFDQAITKQQQIGTTGLPPQNLRLCVCTCMFVNVNIYEFQCMMNLSLGSMVDQVLTLLPCSKNAPGSIPT